MEAWLDGCPPKEDGYLKFIRRHWSCPPEEPACRQAGIPSEGGQAPLAEKPEII